MHGAMQEKMVLSLSDRSVSPACRNRAPGHSHAQEKESAGVHGDRQRPAGARKQQQEGGQRDGGRVGRLRERDPARVGEPPRRDVPGEPRERRAEPVGETVEAGDHRGLLGLRMDSDVYSNVRFLVIFL